MKKLKIKLLSSIIIILLLSFIIRFNQKPVSKYSKNETDIYGIITECENKKDKTTLTVKSKEKVLVNYYDNYKCKLGQKIHIKGKLEKPAKNTVFYLFNYKNYLLSKKILYTFKATSINNINSKIPLKYKIKNKIINHIEKYKSKSYLKAFVLGQENEIEENIKSSYRNNGISHLLAISGSQIITISYIILFILNKTIKNKKLSYIITLYILIFYMFITTFTPSISRATIFFVLTTIKKQFKLKVKTIYLLLLTLLILLNINPYYIYSLGFVLSFTVSFYIILSNKIINRCKSYYAKILVVSIISFISSMPIIINSFFKINLISPIINLFFVPLVSLIIYPLTLITVFVKPLDHQLYEIIKIMEKTSLKIENFSIFTISLSHMNFITIIIYYLIITIIIKIWKEKNKNYLWILIVMTAIYKNINIFNSYPSITMIDVGQGDSLLIKLKNNKGNIVIDTGGEINNKSYSKIKNITIPYLNAEGINNLNYLILTHGDYDHMGEAINLVNNFKVEKVIFNCGPYNNLEKDLIKALDKKKIKYYSCIKELNIDKNKLYFLETKEYDNENDNSNVIYTELDGYKFMFMGDASITTEKEILDKYNLTDIDVLKVGHHGSKTSSSKDFIDEINPKYSIISVGKNNRYGHPNKEALNNLKNSKIYRTDEDGSVMFTIKNNKLKIETCSP